LVLAYDLLEDGCMTDITTTKFFPLCFIAEALNRYEKLSLAGRKEIKPFLSLKNGSENPAVKRD